MQNPTTTSTVGEQLLARLAQRKRTTRERFNIPGADAAIEAYFQDEVRLCRKNYIANDKLSISLAKVGRWLSDGQATDGLLLSGTPGNGKSTAIKAIKLMVSYSGLKDVDNLDYYGNPSDAILHVITAIDLCSMYTSNNKNFNCYKNIGLLAIDDFGTEPAEVMQYGNVITPLTELLYSRYDQRLFTIISTNLLPRHIRERYGERIADRFNDMMTVVTFPDITFRKLNQ